MTLTPIPDGKRTQFMYTAKERNYYETKFTLLLRTATGMLGAEYVLEFESSHYYCFVNHIQLEDKLHYRKKAR
jgi:hypothetical protein